MGHDSRTDVIDALRFLAGIALLVWGATVLVRGASKMALALGVSPLVVGLTVVAFGTSSPEIAVSVGAAWGGRGEMALGNVIGSNIFNVLFILGLSAVVAPLVVHFQLIKQEVPIMIGVALVFVALAIDGTVGRLDGALLLVVLGVYTSFLVVQARLRTERGAAPGPRQAPPGKTWDDALWVQGLLVLGGLALLVVGSEWLVAAAESFARQLGVSEVVIGLTVVAAGTSMPEVATSVAAAWKGERDIAVGNVVGSNTFNILGCLGLSGLVASGGIPVPASVLHFDLWILVAVSLGCLPIFLSGHGIARWEGWLFLGYYAAYTTYLILAAQRHEALEAFSRTMLSFVIPMTIVTLTAVAIRAEPPQANRGTGG